MAKDVVEVVTMCDHSAAKCVGSTGGIESGHFTELYECPCGAEGRISGEASDPSTWDRTGEVFK